MPLRHILLGVLILVPAGALLFSVIQSGWGSVKLDMELTYESPVLTIVGKTTLPDRALLVYEVSPKSEALRQREGVLATGVAVVNKGQYRVEIDTTLFEAKEVVVWIRFQVSPDGPPQNLVIVNQFGTNGERITGENVVHKGENTYIEIFDSLTLDNQ